MTITVEPPRAARPRPGAPRNGMGLPLRTPRPLDPAVNSENDSQGWVERALALFGWRV